jgi:hypothetical protein
VNHIQSIEQRVAERPDLDIRRQRPVAAGDDADTRPGVRYRRLADIAQLFSQERQKPGLIRGTQPPDMIDEQRAMTRASEPFIEVIGTRRTTAGEEHRHEWTGTAHAAIVNREGQTRAVVAIAGRHHHIDE